MSGVLRHFYVSSRRDAVQQEAPKVAVAFQSQVRPGELPAGFAGQGASRVADERRGGGRRTERRPRGRPGRT